MATQYDRTAFETLLGEVHLRRARQQLARALLGIEAAEAAGLHKGDRDRTKELLILRIAEINRLVG